MLVKIPRVQTWRRWDFEFVVFVVVGVRGKPRMHYSLLAYYTVRFGRSNLVHQMPPRLTTRSAL
jgi:hypothetical protein